jgi:hypothetical protein
MPLLPRKNVQQERADRDDGSHQKYSGQNNASHDNTSSARSCLGSEVDVGNLGFWRQIAVRLRQFRLAISAMAMRKFSPCALTVN